MGRSPLPLLDHPLEQASAFTPEALIAAVRRERGLAAGPGPPVCVLDFDGGPDRLARCDGHRPALSGLGLRGCPSNESADLPIAAGPVWTTDAPYRETPAQREDSRLAWWHT